MRERKEKILQDLLSKEKIDQLKEDDVYTLAENLWSMQWWSNIDYIKQLWIGEVGGIENLKKAMRELIWGDDDIAKRYDLFRYRVRGMGSSTITEILNAARPDRYAIWNSQIRKALEKLGIVELSKVYQITGDQYKEIISLLGRFIRLLKDKNAPSEPNFLDVDYFLYYIATQIDDSGQSDTTYDSEEITQHLTKVGSLLGFDVLREVTITPGARVDLVWSSRVGILGLIKYVFEVQTKGSIKSLLMNLVLAAKDPTVQKVIAVSDAEQLELIRREAEPLKELHDKIIYWDVQELRRVSELIEEFYGMIQRLGFTPTP